MRDFTSWMGWGVSYSYMFQSIICWDTQVCHMLAQWYLLWYLCYMPKRSFVSYVDTLSCVMSWHDLICWHAQVCHMLIYSGVQYADTLICVICWHAQVYHTLICSCFICWLTHVCHKLKCYCEFYTETLICIICWSGPVGMSYAHLLRCVIWHMLTRSYVDMLTQWCVSCWHAHVRHMLTLRFNIISWMK